MSKVIINRADDILHYNGAWKLPHACRYNPLLIALLELYLFCRNLAVTPCRKYQEWAMQNECRMEVQVSNAFNLVVSVAPSIAMLSQQYPSIDFKKIYTGIPNTIDTWCENGMLNWDKQCLKSYFTYLFAEIAGVEMADIDIDKLEIGHIDSEHYLAVGRNRTCYICGCEEFEDGYCCGCGGNGTYNLSDWHEYMAYASDGE